MRVCVFADFYNSVLPLKLSLKYSNIQRKSEPEKEEEWSHIAIIYKAKKETPHIKITHIAG